MPQISNIHMGKIWQLIDLGNEIQIGVQGRVVIPAKLRKALYLKIGDRLMAHKVRENLGQA